MPDIIVPYSFYGGNAEAFYDHSHEMILSGPADTGKTLALLTKTHLLCLMYDGSLAAIVRKHQADLYSTAVRTYVEGVLDASGSRELIRAYGGWNRPAEFIYPNGSTLMVLGLYGSRSEKQITSKLGSAQLDLVYVNQAEELALVEWESLLSRTTGRAGHMPVPILMGDANPGPPGHWILRREVQGHLRHIRSSHRDNPALYDPVTGEVTPGGELRLGALRTLSGTRLFRLFHGLWVAPEGAIYDIFEEAKHVIPGFPIPAWWPCVVGVDPVGERTAGIWLAWDSRAKQIHAYKEYYEPFGITTAGHVQNMLKMAQTDMVRAWIGGAKSERQARADFTAEGIELLEPLITDVWAGIDRVYGLLKDGLLLIHDSCPNLIDEIVSYKRKMGRDGLPTDTIEAKEQYHLLDALRYAVGWLLPKEAKTTRVVYDPVRIGIDV